MQEMNLKVYFGPFCFGRLCCFVLPSIKQSVKQFGNTKSQRKGELKIGIDPSPFLQLELCFLYFLLVSMHFLTFLCVITDHAWLFAPVCLSFPPGALFNFFLTKAQL